MGLSRAVLVLSLIALSVSAVTSISLVGPVVKTQKVVKKVQDDVEDSLDKLLSRDEAAASRSKSRSVAGGHRQSGLSSSDTDQVVLVHNQLRAQERAANMQYLHYNQGIADLAQQWSTGCDFTHGNPPFTAANGGFDKLGQNLYLSTGSFSLADGIKAWYDEKKDFTFATGACTPGAMCGHYTQLVWATTTDVGCGMTFCPTLNFDGQTYTDAYYLVCNYGPPGNVVSNGVLEPVYIPGPACTKCTSGVFFCNSELCDNTCTSSGSTCQCGAACQNGGSQIDPACQCSCPNGWTGVDCSAVCQDMNPNCGDNNGWPQFKCSSTDPIWIAQMQQCPLLCGKCAQRSSLNKLNRLKHLLGYIEKEIKEIE